MNKELSLPRLLLVLQVLFFQSLFADGFQIGSVLIGDPGNSADANGWGSVEYPFYIGETEVTNSQYAVFLNAVAANDTYGLYNPNMGSSINGGIRRSGEPGSYTYEVKDGFAEKPVNYVSFWDATRFANWMTNGRPNGEQDVATTETGVYNLLERAELAILARVDRSQTAMERGGVAVVNDDEWHKAAYYDAETRSYREYPTSDGLIPTTETATVDEQPNGATEDQVTDRVAVVKAKEPNINGVYGMAGNVREWIDQYYSSTDRGLRGVSFATRLDSVDQAASNRRFRTNADTERPDYGFRVTSRIPLGLAGGSLEELGVVEIHFDLGRDGERTGGGELTQYFAEPGSPLTGLPPVGSAIVEPEVRGRNGYGFVRWEPDFGTADESMEIKGIFAQATADDFEDGELRGAAWEAQPGDTRYVEAGGLLQWSSSSGSVEQALHTLTFKPTLESAWFFEATVTVESSEIDAFIPGVTNAAGQGLYGGLAVSPAGKPARRIEFLQGAEFFADRAALSQSVLQVRQSRESSRLYSRDGKSLRPLREPGETVQTVDLRIYFNGSSGDIQFFTRREGQSWALIQSSRLSGSFEGLEGKNFGSSIFSGMAPNDRVELSLLSRSLLARTGQGAVRYDDVRVTEIPQNQLQIVQHPSGAELPLGSTHSLSVIATGRQPLSYAWFRQSVNASRGFDSEPATDLGTSSVAIVELDSYDKFGSYYVEVTDADGSSVVSDAAILSERLPRLYLDTSSRDFHFAYREDGSFWPATASVSAWAYGDPPISIEIRDAETNQLVDSGSSSAGLRFGPFSDPDDVRPREFEISASNSGTSRSAFEYVGFRLPTEVLGLHLDSPHVRLYRSYSQLWGADAFVSFFRTDANADQPTHLLAEPTRTFVSNDLTRRPVRDLPFTLNARASHFFSVGSNPWGDMELSYQWFRNGEPLPEQTRSTLYIPRFTQDHDGDYHVFVSGSQDRNGTTVTRSVSSYTLTLLSRQGVLISENPVPKVLYPGDSAVLLADSRWIGRVDPFPTFAYQWLKDGVEIEGATERILELSEVTEQESGNYALRVTVVDVPGTPEETIATSRSASVIVTEPIDGRVIAFGGATPFLPRDVVIEQVSIGDGHTLVLGSNGEVYARGDNAFGQSDVPGLVTTALQVLARGDQSWVVGTDGSVHVWGDVDSAVAAQVAALASIREIAVSEAGLFARTFGNELLRYDWNEAEIPGDPVLVEAGEIIGISLTNSGLALALLADGTLMPSGNGVGSVPADLGAVSKVVVEGDSVLALLTDGSLTAWSTGDDSEFLDNVPGGDSFTAISIGTDADGNPLGAAINGDGNVVFWPASDTLPTDLIGYEAIVLGHNGKGAAFGEGSSVRFWGDNQSLQFTPTFGDLSLTTQIAAGRQALFLDADGSVQQYFIENHYNPVDPEPFIPEDLGDVVQVSRMFNFDYESPLSAALRSDGSVLAWSDDGSDTLTSLLNEQLDIVQLNRGAPVRVLSNGGVIRGTSGYGREDSFAQSPIDFGYVEIIGVRGLTLGGQSHAFVGRGQFDPVLGVDVWPSRDGYNWARFASPDNVIAKSTETGHFLTQDGTVRNRGGTVVATDVADISSAPLLSYPDYYGFGNGNLLIAFRDGSIELRDNRGRVLLDGLYNHSGRYPRAYRVEAGFDQYYALVGSPIGREPVQFVDNALESELRRLLNVPDELFVTAADLASITELRLAGLGIHDLTGIESAIQLEFLDLSDNPGVDSVDLERLAFLPTLETLLLSGTGVTDLRPIANLDLETLDIRGLSFDNPARAWEVATQLPLKLLLHTLEDVAVPGAPFQQVSATLADGSRVYALFDREALTSVDASGGVFNMTRAADLALILALEEAGVTIEPGDNRQPAAAASYSVSREIFGEVTLDASASRDIDGFITEFRWSWGVDGSSTEPVVTISLGEGVTNVQLVVTDNLGAESEPVDFTIELDQETFGLVADLPFDQSTVDVSPARHRARWSDDGLEAYDLFGTSGAAAAFFGNANVNLEGVQTSADETWSWSFWIFDDSPSFSPDVPRPSRIWMATGSGEAFNPDSIVVGERDQRLTVFAGMSGESEVILEAGEEADLFWQDAWQFVVITGDASGVRLYLNGELADSSQSAVIPEPGIQVGGAGDERAWALIDSVRVFDRALTSTEIRAIYEAIEPTLDNDRDGIPDSIELEIFGSLTTATAFSDTDSDGRTDAQEILDGTDPFDADDTTGLAFSLTEPSPKSVFSGAASSAKSISLPEERTLVFDGEAANIREVADSANFDSLSQAHTLSAWVKLDANASGRMAIVGKDDGIENREMLLSVEPIGTARAHAAAADGAYQIVDGSSRIVPGEWFHIAQTWDGLSLTLYVNGQQEELETGVLEGGLPNSSEPLRIGGLVAPEFSPFVGEINDPRVYERSLEPSEVLALYKAAVIVDFADPRFESAIREALGVPSRPVKPSDMETLVELNLSGLEIESLEGLEFATNLQRLNLTGNNLLDLPAVFEVIDTLPLNFLLVDFPRPVGITPDNLIESVIERSDGTSLVVAVDPSRLIQLDASSGFIDVAGANAAEIFAAVVAMGVSVEAGNANLAPVAAIVPVQPLSTRSADGKSVVLDGSQSVDVDGEIVSYVWRWQGGAARGATPTVVLPVGLTTVELTVTDDEGATDRTEVQIVNELELISPLVSEFQTGSFPNGNATSGPFGNTSGSFQAFSEPVEIRLNAQGDLSLRVEVQDFIQLSSDEGVQPVLFLFDSGNLNNRFAGVDGNWGSDRSRAARLTATGNVLFTDLEVGTWTLVALFFEDAPASAVSLFTLNSDVEVLNAPAPDPETPLFAFAFAGDATDVTGNGFDGTAINTYGVQGRFDGGSEALSFNGINAFVELPLESGQYPANDLTISSWLAVANGGAKDQATVLNLNHASSAIETNNGGLILYIDEERRPAVRFVTESTRTNLSPTVVARSPIPANQFVHLAFVREGASSRLYVNGQPVASASGPAEPIDYNSDRYDGDIVEIGRFRRFPASFVAPESSYFDGVIDDLAVYASALSPERIRQLANDGPDLGVTFADANLAAAIRVALGLGEFDPILEADLEDLIVLNLEGLGIRDLDGLQFATNLEIVNIRDNPIADSAAAFAILDGLPLRALFRDLQRAGGVPAGLREIQAGSAAGVVFADVAETGFNTLDLSDPILSLSDPLNLALLDELANEAITIVTGANNIAPTPVVSIEPVDGSFRRFRLSSEGTRDVDGSIAGLVWSWNNQVQSGSTVTARFPLGRTEVVLRVTDNAGAAATRSLEVNIPDLDGDGLADAWENALLDRLADRNSIEEIDPDLDDDGDGTPNWIEFLSELDALNAGQQIGFGLRFGEGQRRITARPGLDPEAFRVTLQQSSTLGNWELADEQNIVQSLDELTVELPEQREDAPATFHRLVIQPR